MNFRNRLCGIVAFGCLLGFAAVGPASASPEQAASKMTLDQPLSEASQKSADVGFPVGQDPLRIQNQADLHVVADQVMSDASGRFAGVVEPVLDVDNRAIKFKWYNITAQQREAVEALGQTHNISVAIEIFPYSSEQVDRAMKSISQNAQLLKGRGLTVTTMIPHSNEGGALLVGIRRASNSDLSLAQAADVLKSISGIDVTISERDFTVVPYVIRQTDVPRFHARP